MVSSIDWTPPRTAFWRADDGWLICMLAGATGSTLLCGQIWSRGPRGLAEVGRLACLCRRRPHRQPEHPFHVVGEIGEADFHFRPGQPDGADGKPHRTLLPGEDVLDAGADL